MAQRAQPSDVRMHFSDRLAEAVLAKRSVVCVGLDPDLDLMPPEFVEQTAAAARRTGAPDKVALRNSAADKAALPAATSANAAPRAAITTDGCSETASADLGGEELAAACCSAFCRAIVAAVADTAAVVKPQAAFFEQYGAAGWRALGEVIAAAHEHGLPVILDVKRGDIASTARAYSRAAFGGAPLPGGGVGAGLGADAVTLSPYLGDDSLEPFVARCADGHGVFVLTRTSNAGAAALQEQMVGRRPLYLLVADLVARLTAGCIGDHGYSDVGVVAGATAPAALAAVRTALPRAFILVPGIGAQGGQVEALRGLAAGDATGLVVNSSRSVLYAWRDRGGDFRDAAAKASEELRDQLAGVFWR